MEKQPMDFIDLAVRQVHGTQAFGFTRNEACRNLKIAIQQYWQNKTLKLHGQSQKDRIHERNPWTRKTKRMLRLSPPANLRSSRGR